MTCLVANHSGYPAIKIWQEGRTHPCFLKGKKELLALFKLTMFSGGTYKMKVSFAAYKSEMLEFA